MFTTDYTDIYNALDISSKKDFDDIVYQRVLGASSHIRMIGDMIEKASLNSKNIDELKDRVHTISTFFINTRGEASQAIKNAIMIMIKGLDSYSGSIEDVQKKVIDTKNDYFTTTNSDIQLAIDYGVNLCKNFKCILIYDYSSTVAKMISKLPNKIKVFIPESRAINGGVPFIDACIEAKHQIHFIPDASIMYFLKECDAVFMGAETIYPDGTGFNTIGSDMVGLMCNTLNIPLYFITTLIKTDIRQIYGHRKKLVINDLKEKFVPLLPNNLKYCDIDYTCPELVPVAPEHIRGFITEKGIIPSYQLYNISIDYINQLNN